MANLLSVSEQYARFRPRNMFVDGCYAVVSLPITWCGAYPLSTRRVLQPVIEEVVNQCTFGSYVGLLHSISELGNIPPVLQQEVEARVAQYAFSTTGWDEALWPTLIGSQVAGSIIAYNVKSHAIHKVGNNGRGFFSGMVHSALTHVSHNLAVESGNTYMIGAHWATFVAALMGYKIPSKVVLGLAVASQGALTYQEGLPRSLAETCLAASLPELTGHDIEAAVSSLPVKEILAERLDDLFGARSWFAKAVTTFTGMFGSVLSTATLPFRHWRKFALCAAVAGYALLWWRSRGSYVRSQTAPKLPAYMFDGLRTLDQTCARFGVGCVVNNTDVDRALLPDLEHTCNLDCGCGRRPLFVSSDEVPLNSLPWGLIQDVAVIFKRGELQLTLQHNDRDFNISLVSSTAVNGATYHVAVATPATITRIVVPHEATLAVCHGTFTYEADRNVYHYTGPFGRQTIKADLVNKCAAGLANLSRDDKYMGSVKSYTMAQLAAAGTNVRDTMAVLELVARLSDDYATRYSAFGVVDPRASTCRRAVQRLMAPIMRTFQSHTCDALLSNVVLNFRPARHIFPWKFEDVRIPAYTMWCSPHSELRVDPRLPQRGPAEPMPFLHVPPPGPRPDGGAQHGAGDQPPEYDSLDHDARARPQPPTRPSVDGLPAYSDTDGSRTGARPRVRDPSPSTPTDAGPTGGIWVDSYCGPLPPTELPGSGGRCTLVPGRVRGTPECCDTLHGPISYLCRNYGPAPTPTSETPTIGIHYDESGLSFSIPGLGEATFDGVEVHQVLGGYHDTLFFAAARQIPHVLGPPGSRNFERLSHVRDHFIHLLREVRGRNHPA